MQYFFLILLLFNWLFHSNETAAETSKELLLEAQGWVLVPRSDVVEDLFDEVDPSIWVIFSKKESNESFEIRFPSDPVYRHEEGKSIFSSNSDRGYFELIIAPKEDPSLSVSSGDQEKVVRTADNIFFLRSDSSAEDFQYFVDSLNLR